MTALLPLHLLGPPLKARDHRSSDYRGVRGERATGLTVRNGAGPDRQALKRTVKRCCSAVAVHRVKKMKQRRPKTETLPRYLPTGFETLEQARQESNVRQKDLAKRPRKQSRALGQKLAECRDENPCQSAACPVCRRNNRIRTIGEATKFYESGQAWRVVTLIFYAEAMTSKRLSVWDAKQLKNRLYKQMVRAGIKGPVIGGLEVDYHRDTKHWLPHFHLLIPWDATAFEKLRQSMKKQGKLDLRLDVVSRPMYVRKVKDPANQISYLFKSYCSEVVSYTINGKRWTTKQRLPDKKHALSLRVLDRLGFTTLNFQYGVRNTSISKRRTSTR